MKTLTKLAVLFVLLLSTAAFAQGKDYSDEPGYVNFGNLADFETEEMVTEVILEDHILRMVSKITKGEDEDLSKLIGGLKLIRVNAFEVNTKNESELFDKVKSVDKDLMGEGWDRIVKSRSKSESAYVYIKTDGTDNIYGLVVMAIDGSGEAVFVNIVGDINLETIGKLGAKFDIPALDQINGK
jgi:Skp family chaperone for outer membrane proteins